MADRSAEILQALDIITRGVASFKQLEMESESKTLDRQLKERQIIEDRNFRKEMYQLQQNADFLKSQNRTLENQWLKSNEELKTLEGKVTELTGTKDVVYGTYEAANIALDVIGGMATNAKDLNIQRVKEMENNDLKIAELNDLMTNKLKPAVQVLEGLDPSLGSGPKDRWDMSDFGLDAYRALKQLSPDDAVHPGVQGVFKSNIGTIVTALNNKNEEANINNERDLSISIKNTKLGNMREEKQDDIFTGISNDVQSVFLQKFSKDTGTVVNISSGLNTLNAYATQVASNPTNQEAREAFKFTTNEIGGELHYLMYPGEYKRNISGHRDKKVFQYIYREEGISPKRHMTGDPKVIADFRKLENAEFAKLDDEKKADLREEGVYGQNYYTDDDDKNLQIAEVNIHFEKALKQYKKAIVSGTQSGREGTLKPLKEADYTPMNMLMSVSFGEKVNIYRRMKKLEKDGLANTTEYKRWDYEYKKRDRLEEKYFGMALKVKENEKGVIITPDVIVNYSNFAKIKEDYKDAVALRSLESNQNTNDTLDFDSSLSIFNQSITNNEEALKVINQMNNEDTSGIDNKMVIDYANLPNVPQDILTDVNNETISFIKNLGFDDTDVSILRHNYEQLNPVQIKTLLQMNGLIDSMDEEYTEDELFKMFSRMFKRGVK